MTKRNVTTKWMKIYNDMEKLFESWKRRKLTLFGKSCIINTLAISKLIYVASILCLPGKEFLKKIQRLIFNFVWNKSERIKRNTLIGDVRNGGLGIIDVESKLKALKAAWLPRIIKSKGVLYNILNGFCKKYNIDVMYVLQFSSNVDNLKFPLFYKEILCSVNECKISRLDVMSNVDIGSRYGTIVICDTKEIYNFLKIGLKVASYL